MASPVGAQTAFYTFSSGPGGDGFTWDIDSPPSGLNDLPDQYVFAASTSDSSGQIDFYNDSGNVTYFDNNYQAAGGSTVIDGDAWWGNPNGLNIGYIGVDSFNTLAASMDFVSFDFAWAIAGEEVSPFVYIEVYDQDFDYAYLEFELTDTFDAGPAFGGFDGYEGSIFFDMAEILRQDESAELDQIAGFNIDVNEVALFDGVGEFALDNLSINNAPDFGSNVFPSVNDGEELEDGTILQKSVLVNTGLSTLAIDVTNDGDADTTVSTQVEFGGELDDLGQLDGLEVPAGQTVYTGDLVGLDTDTPTGTYGSDLTFSNDLNPRDPDSTVTFQIAVHDAPSLTANNGSPVDAAAQQLTLANAPAGPHAGALRAGVEATSVATTGPFELAGLEVGDQVGAGENIGVTAALNRFGRLSGLQTGTATVGLKMVSQYGFFLENAAPVDAVVWNLEETLADVDSDDAALDDGTPYANRLGVNHDATAATLIGGDSPSAQSVAMQYVANPETGGAATATLLDSPVEASFSNDSGLYVLQFTYDDAQLGGLNESDLRLLFYDAGAQEYDLAIAGNTSGGGAFSLQSYATYLAGAGGVLDASDLGAHGVDATGNQVWAVLDHQAVFGLGVLGMVSAMAGDFNADGVVDAADYTVWRDNLGQSVTLPGDETPGQVTAADYATWRANYGAGAPAPPAGATAPEPAAITGVLLVVVTCGWPGVRRR